MGDEVKCVKDYAVGGAARVVWCVVCTSVGLEGCGRCGILECAAVALKLPGGDGKVQLWVRVIKGFALSPRLFFKAIEMISGVFNNVPPVNNVENTIRF